MAKIRITMSIDEKTAKELELLSKHKFRSDRMLSMYSSNILTDHCDANRALINRLKANPVKK